MDIYKSSETKLKDTICNEPIYIITQFYLPTNSNRKRELLNSLKLIVYNNMIDKIYLLNERIYSDEELGIQSNKIKQINIEKRLLYSICFDYIEKLSLNGYIIITNSDIFFDKSLMYIKQCNLENEKKVYCQLRHEYDETKLLSECKLFTNNTQKYGRADSQDTWIFHSKYNIPKCNRKIFEFSMGKPGCDNKLVYLWNILGYQCYNEPELIKCYHYHMSNIRNYVQSNSLPGPYRGIYPIIKSSQNFIFSHNYNFKTENQELSSYIEKKIQAKENFIIPRLAGIENNLAHESVLFIKKEITDKNVLLSKIKIMKNNAGIYLSSLNSIINYSQLYLNAFEKCDVYFDWSVFSNVAKYSKNSFPFMYNNFKKKRVDSETLSIFNHIHIEPWTLKLRGLRILIVSSFIESIKEKINDREKIYNIDLFPECTFVFLKPPQTNGSNPSQDFSKELDYFCKKIKEIENDFDIALCSCGGYGNLVCSYIYDLNKSAIYVGGVLQMYFGIYGERWIRETPDILKIYLNKYWSRPKKNERPNDYDKIEKSCYW
tara:strand:- start:40713 stop:42347 length:1635 start_codon:yes stop_codon:yes gene_type:complete